MAGTASARPIWTKPFSARALTAAISILAVSVPSCDAQNPALEGVFTTVANGLVASIHAVLVPRTGKVIMLERVDGGQNNGVHAAEFDIQSFTSRPLAFATDVFCSAGFVSPDPLARIFNVGGWSGPATEAVRVYTPCGAPGGNFGQCEWFENANQAALKLPRWYPSALPLPSGRVAVIGGTTSATGLFPPPINQPSVEFLPPLAGEKPITVQLLVDTDTYNLYPHAHVLPSGQVLLIAGDRAQILNADTFELVAELPAIPGGRRTYPFTGGSVLLTLTSRNGYTAEVLVCGGGSDTKIAAPALDSCARIAPLVAANAAGAAQNAAGWLLETMPLARVMPDLTLLADGTVLILNGAENGWSGFANAENPVTTAVLYDPDAPFGQRFRTLATSPIARLYHSEALLLDDGRVLVFGSTPNADANVDPTTVPYPNERRIEIYTPPYLVGGPPRPTVSVAGVGAPNWLALGYKTNAFLNVVLPSGNAGNAKIVIMTNGFVTHSTHMGQRRVELDAVWNAAQGNLFSVQITTPAYATIAPPGWYQLFVLDGRIPSVAIWVQIGGDPAGVANYAVGNA